MAGALASWMPQQVLRAHGPRTEHQIRWQVDLLRVALIRNMAGFEIDRLAYWADFQDEIVAASYEPGGMILDPLDPVYDEPTRQVRLMAASARWEGTVEAEGALIWKDTGDPARSPLVGVSDFGGARRSVDGEFVIEWHTELGALAYEVVVPVRFDTLVAA